jgi:hypothetical protein
MPHAAPIERLLDAIAAVPGLRAVVLGGSRARGTAIPNSDYDIGLYYAASHPLDTTALLEAIRPVVDDPAHAAVTGIGAWGPWINGGAWLSIDRHKVDLLYRDLDQVGAAIAQCRAGQIGMHYQPGHPHGFCSAHLMGEVALCKPLLDPGGAIAALKALTDPYPRELAAALTERFLGEALFSIQVAAIAVPRGEQTFVAGCAYRTLSCVAQVLFAANARYLIHEKGALAQSTSFPLCIADLMPKTKRVWRAIADLQLAHGVNRLEEIYQELARVVKIDAVG